LLTAPLLAGRGRGRESDSPLSLAEYNKLAHQLKSAGSEPADLLQRGWEETLAGLDLERIRRLLERGVLLSLAVDRWRERTIWVVSRADAAYPLRLKERLGPQAPPVLYGCGNQELLESGGLAIVGPRDAGEELLEYAETAAALAAEAGAAIISGAARGVDQAAMRGALRRWGNVAGVLSSDLEREALNREHREMLMEGNLVLVSPYDPKAGFSVGNAMGRNKLIYALSDAGLVVESDAGRGGTWSGAAEQLDKVRQTPVYVRWSGAIGDGLRGLRKKGALPWPEPATPGELRELLASGSPACSEPASQPPLPLISVAYAAQKRDGGTAEDTATEAPGALPPESLAAESSIEEEAPPANDAADALFAKVEELMDSMDMPVTQSAVAELLQVQKKQAQAWLDRLVSEGRYQKLSRPARYARIPR